MQPAPRFYTDPTVQYLSQVLEDLKRGEIQIPRFQRPLVWTLEDRLALFESIRDGIPIGSILIWRTMLQNLAVYDQIGPLHLKPPRNSEVKQFLLDGVQRLTTLLTALIPQTANNDLSSDKINALFDEYDSELSETDPDQLSIGYDLELEEFTPKHLGTSTTIPLDILFDSYKLLGFQRNLSHLTNSEILIERSDRLAKAFREYKIALIPMTTEDLSLAARTFQKINTAGKDMSELHMVHALSWSSDFDLHESLSSLRKSLSVLPLWSRVSDEIILKCLKAHFGLDLYKTQADSLSQALKRAPDRISVVAKSLLITAKLLKDNFFIDGPNSCPYSLQVALIASAIPHDLDSLTEQQEKHICDWLILTSYREYFTGLSNDKTATALRNLKELISVGSFRRSGFFEIIKSEPEFERARRFDYRKARSKLQLIAWAKESLFIEEPDKILLIKNQGPLAERIYTKPDLSPAYISLVGNRFFSRSDSYESKHEASFNRDDEVIDFTNIVLERETNLANNSTIRLTGILIDDFKLDF